MVQEWNEKSRSCLRSPSIIFVPIGKNGVTKGHGLGHIGWYDKGKGRA